jgi:hypothetical protein
MSQDQIEAEARRIVADAPPLNDDQKRRLALVLRGGRR